MFSGRFKISKHSFAILVPVIGAVGSIVGSHMDQITAAVGNMGAVGLVAAPLVTAFAPALIKSATSALTTYVTSPDVTVKVESASPQAASDTAAAVAVAVAASADTTSI